MTKMKFREVHYPTQAHTASKPWSWDSNSQLSSLDLALWETRLGHPFRTSRLQAFPGTLHVCMWPLGAQASQLQQTPFRRFRTLSTPAQGPWENWVAFEGAPQAHQHLYYFTLSLQDHQMRNSWACRFIRVLQVIPSALPFPS